MAQEGKLGRIDGQAQKELTHNESLLKLDLLVQPTCAALPSNTAPPVPAPGEAFLCGDAPSGAWEGQANALALWTTSGWRFSDAFEGMQVLLVTTGAILTFRDGGWDDGRIHASAIVIDGVQVLGRREPAIPDPSGGATIDAEARQTLQNMLAALRAHGLIAE
jgi:hypothetical protein